MRTDPPSPSPAPDTTLVTPRLRLRPKRLADFPEIRRLDLDAEVQHFLGRVPVTPAETRAYLEADVAIWAGAEPRSRYNFAVTRREDGALVGLCGLAGVVRGPASAEIGWQVRREDWGRGYATEAAAALLAWAFGTLRLHRVWAWTTPDNLASLRVMAKLGLRPEGRLRDHQRTPDGYRDALVHAILEPEWRAAGEG